MTGLTSLLFWLLSTLGPGEPCGGEEGLDCSDPVEIADTEEPAWLGFLDISNGF